MFVIVYNPTTDDIYYQRRMAPNEKLNLRKFADLVASEFDAEIDTADGHIPNCSGDLRVEFRPYRDKAWHIWDGQSYYLKQ